MQKKIKIELSPAQATALQAILLDFETAGFEIDEEGDVVLAKSPWGNIHRGDCLEDVEIYFGELAHTVLKQLPEVTFICPAIPHQ